MSRSATKPCMSRSSSVSSLYSSTSIRAILSSVIVRSPRSSQVRKLNFARGSTMTTHTPAKATRYASPWAPRVASATNFLHHFRGTPKRIPLSVCSSPAVDDAYRHRWSRAAGTSAPITVACGTRSKKEPGRSGGAAIRPYSQSVVSSVTLENSSCIRKNSVRSISDRRLISPQMVPKSNCQHRPVPVL